MISRRAFVSRLATASAVLPLGACGSFGHLFSRNRVTRGITGLTSIALSPDGAQIAVNYREKLFLYDWRRATLAQLPRDLDQPAFSPDGRCIAGIADKRQLAYIELASGEATGIEWHSMDLYALDSPRYAPDGRSIAFAAHHFPIGKAIALADLATGEVRYLTDPKYRFYGASDLCFVGPGEIVFQASVPHDPVLLEQLRDLNLHSPVHRFQCRLTFDPAAKDRLGEVSILRPQFDERPSYAGQINGLCASRRGEVWAWLGWAMTDGGREVFERRGGATRAITNRRTYSFACAISQDAGIVAFTEDRTRGTDFDLVILDRQTGAVIETGLLAKLRGSAIQ